MTQLYAPQIIAERILLKFLRRDLRSTDDSGYTDENALDYALKTVPGLLDIVRDKAVLDFGCGAGLQAAIYARHARRVVGLDLPRPGTDKAWSDPRLEGIPNLRLTTQISSGEQFDVVVSCGSFEHFADPEGTLAQMRELTRPGGAVIVTFAQPWFSPRGSHMIGITKVPWVNLLFPEAVVMSVRARFYHDGAMRYEEVEGGLNRMTVARFERAMCNSGMRIRWMRLFAVKRLPLVTSIPVLRELLTAACSCVLDRS